MAMVILRDVISLMRSMDDDKAFYTLYADVDGVLTTVIQGTLNEVSTPRILGLYGSKEATWRVQDHNIYITYKGKVYSSDQKFIFNVGTTGGDGYASGKVVLTYDQALAVAYVCNKNNWRDLFIEFDDGDMSIDLDNFTEYEK